MKLLICFTALIVVFYLIGFIAQKGVDTSQKMEVMSFEFTTALKGVAILFVVWGHLGAYYGIQHLQTLPGIGVALFLFCSGYGIHKSSKKNGLSSYWAKKFLNIAIPYYMIDIFIRLYEGRLTSVRQVLLFGDQWYLWFLFICYAIYWISGGGTQKIRIQKADAIYCGMYSCMVFC